MPDQGDGTYRNPVLFADYSDPDVVRVGPDYYLTASSFLAVPGLPILHSRDLVNWTLINHALPRQLPIEHFSKPRHGQGVWAPAIRFHDGRFWIFYPDPDFGLYVTTAVDPAGDWTSPVLFKPGKGLIDPCPFWDEDGQLYVVHAWAKSRAGIANQLTLLRLNATATATLDAGEVIIDANRMPGWSTLEGPKLYHRGGYYYIFAPAGGVATGYQAVFRARSIHGPYESRIVLDQGRTPINGPHQGAWVDTPTGENWFLHFQDRGAYGRVVHLQPMVWRDDWPIIGSDSDSDGKGEPILTGPKPTVVAAGPRTAPATTDEFDGSRPGLQWQWNANPQPGWASTQARAGWLQLTSVPTPARRNDGSDATGNRYDAPNFLLQKFPAPTFTVTTALDFTAGAPGEFAGLAVFGYDYALLGLRREASGNRLVLLVNREAHKAGATEVEVASVAIDTPLARLRVSVGPDAICRFAYSTDDRVFTPIGESFRASGDRWIGAKVGLIASAQPGGAAAGHADFDWFRFTPSTD